LDVRHGRALGIIGAPSASADTAAQVPPVTEDSYGLYSDVTAAPDTQRA